MTQRRLAELLSKEGPRIRRRFREVMQRVRDQNTVAKLETALAEGTIAKVLDDVEKAAEAVSASVAATHTAAAHEASAYLSRNLDKLVTYDGTNARAVEVLRANRLRLVGGITEQQRVAVQEILAAGITAGTNPRKMATAIRDVIGLSPKQARAVAAYRHRLEAVEPTPLNSDTPGEQQPKPAKVRPPEQVDRMVERFAASKLKKRATEIARTEALAAVHEGLAQSFDQAVERGVIEADAIVQKWIIGGDNHRPWHASMHGQERPWGEPFESGLGNQLRFPGDQSAPPEERKNCQCAVVRRIVRKPDIAKGARMSERIFIAGAPRTGKSTRARELAASAAVPLLPTDDFMHLEWSEASEVIASLVADGQPRIVEGVRVPHVLRKMLAAAPDVRPCDRLIVLTCARAEQTKKQVSMGKAAATVLDGILPALIALGVRVEVEGFAAAA